MLDNYQKVMQGKDISSPLLQFLKDPPQLEKFEVTRESLTNLETIQKHLMASISAKTQELGMKMMDLKEQ